MHSVFPGATTGAHERGDYIYNKVGGLGDLDQRKRAQQEDLFKYVF